MITESPPWRRPASLLAAIAVAAGAVVLPTTAASAAEGAAPAPREYRVIAGVHTDAVSTFLDGGQLAMASKADVEEGNGTRFDANDIWFHLEDDAQMTVPAGYEFIAPQGSTVWMAPESNPGAGKLWPGFSTESIEPGAIDGDRTTFTLTGVEGPGDLELFVGGSFGAPNRLWSSDEPGLESFEVGRTHMHANWAFTEPGTYRIGVEGAVSVDGQRQTSDATYTFIVGELAEAVATETALTASAASVAAGEAVTLDASVIPADAAGYVEFRDGENVLGHEPVVEGRASFEVADLPLGTRSLTAAFVPEVVNEASASVSDAVTVTVTEEAGGEEFDIYGLADSYQAGETIELRPGGATLEAGQQWRWLIRAEAGGTSYTSHELTAVDRYVRDATIGLDGHQISLQLQAADGTVLQQTAWHELRIEGENRGSGVEIAATPLNETVYSGDRVETTIEHDQLADGEAGRWVRRSLPTGVAWQPTNERTAPHGTNPYLFDTSYLNSAEYAYEIVDADGAVIGRSAALSTTVVNRELQLSGIQSVYRAGDTLRAASDLYPARDGLVYNWFLWTRGESWQPIEGATESTVEVPITAELDGVTLILEVSDAETGFNVGTVRQELRVTDAAAGEQLVLLDSLSGHYHQGNPIRLNATADPVASDTDTYRWLWQRPDQSEFVPIEGVTTASHEVRAQQALDGTMVKAELLSAEGELLATSETVTIFVDDHGAAPQEVVSIDGLADHYHSGDEVTLTASVNPDSVLTRWEWYVQRQGEEVPMLVEGENGPELSFAATAELDGAAVFASLTFDDGRTYVESAPVLLTVDDHGEQPVQPTITIEGLADHYHSGDTMTLTATQDPDTGEDHWHWFIKQADATEYEVISGQLTNTLTREVTSADDGASIIARLYDHDHEVIGESEPVVVAVNDHNGEEPGGEEPGGEEPGGEEPGGEEPGGEHAKPGDAPQQRTGDELDGMPEGGLELSAATVTQGQVLSIGLGGSHANQWVAAWLFSEPTLLNGDWTQANGDGVLAVRIPADATPGDHRIGVFAADGSLIGWATVTVTASDGQVPTGSLPSTGADTGPAWLALPFLLVGAGMVTLLLVRRKRATFEG